MFNFKIFNTELDLFKATCFTMLVAAVGYDPYRVIVFPVLISFRSVARIKDDVGSGVI
jgi:hypothetical protein